MAPSKRTESDLGIIRIVSQGTRDVVYLRHNNLRAFAVSCPPDKASRIRVNKAFYAYDRHQWNAVFTAYVDWKRLHAPQFRLPHFSGRKTTGEKHPWRRMPAHQPKTRPRL